MGLLAINRTVKKYLHLYWIGFKYSMQSSMAYKGNFIVCILVELVYQVAYFAFFGIIITQTKGIAGWGTNEMLILLGYNTIMSELITGMFIVWNTRELPRKIWNGELDRVLLKPIHPLFSLTLGTPYFPSFLSSITGVILVFIGFLNLNIALSLGNLIVSVLFFTFGYIIVSSILIIFSLFTFFFQDTWTLPRIGERVAYSFTTLPHNIFTGALKFIFFLIVPVVYVSSFSADALFNKSINYYMLLISGLLSVTFVLLILLVWKLAIKNYSSASS